MSFRLQAISILDPKTCYDLWAKQRYSIYKIPKILAERGIINPISGKPVSPQGVRRAAYLYMLSHIETAKADTASLFSQYGKVFDAEAERIFYVELLNKARQFFSRKSYKIFLLQHPEFRQYE